MEPAKNYYESLQSEDPDYSLTEGKSEQASTRYTEEKPTTQPSDESDLKEDTQPEFATVKLKLVETNITKLRNPDTSGYTMPQDKTFEMKDYKIEQQFKVKTADIPNSATFKSNYLKSTNSVEIALSFNPLLPMPSFDCIREILLNELKNEQSKELNFQTMGTKDVFNYFVAACAIENEELATFLFEQKLYKTITLEHFMQAFLTVLENGLKELSFKIFKKFREYVLAYFDLYESPDEVITRLKGKREDDWEVTLVESTITCYENEKIKIIFNSDIFKRVFERYAKSVHETYMKPELQYNLCKINRKKTMKEGEYCYPHYYDLKKENTQQPLLQGARLTEHGKFLIFSKEPEHHVPYCDEYVGCIEPNYWGTAFEIYDSGLDEATLAKVPKFVCRPRRLLAKVVYDTNIMGDKPRYFSVFFWNFLENREDKLINVKPEYDQRRECYTLNFYGRAKLASARNFHLIYPEDPDSIILMHGKDNRNEFNLVFRHPLNMVQSFAISLISIGKKFCVA